MCTRMIDQSLAGASSQGECENYVGEHIGWIGPWSDGSDYSKSEKLGR